MQQQSLRWPTMLSLLLCLAILPAHGAAAQGHPSASLNLALLRDGADTMAGVLEYSGQVVPLWIIVESLRRVQRENRAAWEHTYRGIGRDGSPTMDTLWLDATTLLPLENHQHREDVNAVTIFRASGARTRVIPVRGRGEQVSDTSVAGPLFAASGLLTIIRASPLALGFAATYQLYYGLFENAVHSTSFRVTGTETLELITGEPVVCWVVEAKMHDGVSTFHVGKADRRFVRLVNRVDSTAVLTITR